MIDNQSLIMPLIPPLLNQTGNSSSAETISIPFSHQRVRARSIMMRAWVEKAEAESKGNHSQEGKDQSHVTSALKEGGGTSPKNGQ